MSLTAGQRKLLETALDSVRGNFKGDAINTISSILSADQLYKEEIEKRFKEGGCQKCFRKHHPSVSCFDAGYRFAIELVMGVLQ